MIGNCRFASATSFIWSTKLIQVVSSFSFFIEFHPTTLHRSYSYSLNNKIRYVLRSLLVPLHREQRCLLCPATPMTRSTLKLTTKSGNWISTGHSTNLTIFIPPIVTPSRLLRCCDRSYGAHDDVRMRFHDRLRERNRETCEKMISCYRATNRATNLRPSRTWYPGLTGIFYSAQYPPEFTSIRSTPSFLSG